MVLHVVKRGPDLRRIHVQRPGQNLLQVTHLTHVGQAVLDRGERWASLQGEQHLPVQVRRGVAADRDVIDLRDVEPGVVQAEPYRLRREAGPVLDPADALFLDRGDEFAVRHQTGCRITVVGIDAENVHGLSLTARAGSRLGS
jgi:hypothetical protein